MAYCTFECVEGEVVGRSLRPVIFAATRQWAPVATPLAEADEAEVGGLLDVGPLEDGSRHVVHLIGETPLAIALAPLSAQMKLQRDAVRLGVRFGLV